MFFFSQILFAILALSVALEIDCPPKDKIAPCSCDSDSDETITYVTCEKFGSVANVEPAIKNSIGHNVSFGFWKTNIGNIPSNIFEGQQSVFLHFEDCEIESFGDKPFSGLENSLAQIYIYDSVQNLQSFRLSHLKKLRILDFLGNDIEKLGNDWFENGPQSLEKLDLQANAIKTLGDKAFSSLVNLQELWMGDNRLKTVSRSMFPNPAKKLWLLEIDFNELEELPSDFFEGYPVLRKVNFSGNKLKTLQESVWSKVWSQLEEVYFERNRGFVCDENLKWIYKQNLPKQFFGKCGSGNNLSGRELSTLTLDDFK